MINLKTKLRIADNSGGIIGKCIKILNSTKKSTRSIGSLILITIVKKKKRKQLKKRNIYYGLVIMVCNHIKRKDGTYVKFTENRVLLLSKNYKFLGSRIYGINLKELKYQIMKDQNKKQKYLKLLSYSNSII
jgi:large subunit ribosomal protein L14